MTLLGGDDNPLICGRVVMYNPVPMGRPTLGWTSVYLKGCSFDGSYATFPMGGKYAFTLRIAVTGVDRAFRIWLEGSQWENAWGGWDSSHGGLNQPSEGGTTFMNWSSIGNVNPGERISVDSSGYDGVTSVIQLPRAPVWEWFLISENIGDRSAAAWFW